MPTLRPPDDPDPRSTETLLQVPMPHPEETMHTNGATTQGPSIVKRSKAKPDRIILYTPPKWGKTSFAAQFPEPLFVTTKGEDGLQKLIAGGRLAETNHYENTFTTYRELMLALTGIAIQSPVPFKTLVIDTGNGVEALAQAHICREHFNDEWGEKGFAGFQRGAQITANTAMADLITTLDAIREQQNARILILCHTDVRNTKNPGGLDYPKVTPAISQYTWKRLSAWTDMILYGDFDVIPARDNPKDKLSKAKGAGGENRIIYCNPRAWFEAGNRHGLPDEIQIGNSPQEAWKAFVEAFKKK